MKERFKIGDRVRVSNEDLELAQLNWHIRKSKNGPSYLKRTLPRPLRGDVYLHREIMSRVHGRTLLRTEIVDHINRDTLDNRRENLRITTKSGNAINSLGHKDRKNPHKNIYWHRKSNAWVVKLFRSGKCISLGYHKSLVSAVKARNKWLFGEERNNGRI